MFTRVLSRLVVLGALACATVAAHAFSIDIASQGTYAVGAGTATSAELVIFQNSSVALPALTSMSLTFSTSLPYNGNAAYTNGVDSLSLSFTYTPDVPTDPFSFTQTTHGVWTYTGGTGVFAGLQGSGVIATNFNGSLGQTSMTILSGRLETVVPEPATLAVIGVGALGLLRRRRRA